MMQQFEYRFYGTGWSKDLHSFPVSLQIVNWIGQNAYASKKKTEKNTTQFLKSSCPLMYSYSPASANVNTLPDRLCSGPTAALKSNRTSSNTNWSKAVVDFSHIKRLF